MENLDFHVRAALKVTNAIIDLLSFHYYEEEDIYADDKDWDELRRFIVPACRYIEETINAIETVSAHARELVREYIILCIANAYLFKEEGVMDEKYAATLLCDKLQIQDLNCSDAKTILGLAEDLCLDIWLDNDELWESQLEAFEYDFNKLVQKNKG